jgi:hypothetical protein
LYKSRSSFPYPYIKIEAQKETSFIINYSKGSYNIS